MSLDVIACVQHKRRPGVVESGCGKWCEDDESGCEEGADASVSTAKGKSGGSHIYLYELLLM